MRLVLPQSGQLVHVFGTREEDLGIYLAPGSTSVYVFFDRAEQGWRLYHYHASTDFWRLTPRNRVIAPQTIGNYLVWQVPPQTGIPDIEIGWRIRLGTWSVPAHVPVTGLGLARRDPPPW